MGERSSMSLGAVSAWPCPACLPTSLQGRSPFPYALAELVDNALRATWRNQGARRIEVTLATTGAAGTKPVRVGYVNVGCAFGQQS